MGKTLKNLCTSKYWSLCLNSCYWNICFEKKPKESVVETFKNISTVGFDCWYIKDSFAGCFSTNFWKKKNYFRR